MHGGYGYSVGEIGIKQYGDVMILFALSLYWLFSFSCETSGMADTTSPFYHYLDHLVSYRSLSPRYFYSISHLMHLDFFML